MTVETRSSRAVWITLALLVSAVSLTHGITLAGEFVYDDTWVVVNNPFLTDPANLARLWTGELPADLPDGNRPFVVGLYLLDYRLFGLDPRGWHLHNLLWHLACTLLLAGLGRSLSHDERIARSAGLLFAVHPLLSEAVAVVSYREDLVATTAMVGALWLVVRSRQTGRALPIAGASLALLCGTNAKEIVPVFPGLLAAYDLCFSRDDLRGFLRRSGWTYLPLTLAAFGSRFWLDALLAPGVLQTVQGAQALAPLARIATGTKITLAYLGQLLVPVHLSSDYATPVEQQLGAASWLGGLAIVALLGLALANARRHPVPAFGLLWLLIGLLPTSGIAPLQNPRADRYLYLPAAGFLLALAWGLVRCRDRLAPRLRSPRLARLALPVSLALLCGVYAGLAFERDRVWHDELTLWETTLRQQPDSLRAQLALMSEYQRRGRLEDALRIGQSAQIAHPNSWQLQLNLGQILDAQRRPRQALEAYTRAAALGGGDDPRLIDNLAVAHVHAGDPRRALELLQRGVEHAPRDVRLQQHLGRVAYELGEYALAARALEAATALDPGDVGAYVTLARSQLRLGQLDAARTSIDRALALAPRHELARRVSARIARLEGTPGSNDAVPTEAP